MRSVLITGTSTGIGQATAGVLAARGWRVFATMRNLQKRSLLEQALKEAGAQNGVEIEQLDVASGASIQAATEGIGLATNSTPSCTMPAWRPPAPWKMCQRPNFGG
jgi:NAD(P)-dependent dehydrogenase (short-subunit alcohol dehydrogenase family)